jgi:hypothetical protein
MSGEEHFDGGRLQAAVVTHRHVIEHDDGQASAIVLRGVPARVCDLCEDAYYEESVTDALVSLIERTAVAPGQAVAVQFPAADAA